MYECKILSKMFTPLGNNISVTANITQKLPTFKKVVDTISLEVVGGYSMTDESIEEEVLKIYEASLT